MCMHLHMHVMESDRKLIHSRQLPEIGFVPEIRPESESAGVFARKSGLDTVPEMRLNVPNSRKSEPGVETDAHYPAT